MKKTNGKIVLVLALAFAAMLAMSTFSYADTNTVNGGSYTFDGTDIVAEDAAGLSDIISGMEPGDSVTITLKYTNGYDGVTDWYMKNDVIKTLEESSDASGGGYTYILTNVSPGGGEQEIFNSDAVGGEQTEAGVGLHQAENATEEWFFIQELSKGESGKTVLYVALDGESQANAYQGTSANIDILYAVEKQDEGDTIYKHVKNGSAKTGDDSSLLLPIMLLILALILMALTALSYLRDRKGGVNDEN